MYIFQLEDGRSESHLQMRWFESTIDLLNYCKKTYQLTLHQYYINIYRLEANGAIAFIDSIEGKIIL